ncbi:MAG TPA: ECF-type sigma factor [Phycisphaerae bacterium]|nr:ECF-type sigma factor [Phycisphaerae bacterium]
MADAPTDTSSQFAAAAPRRCAGQPEGWITALYDELRTIASRQLRSERPGHTLHTTALVHEAYVRLAQTREAEWQSPEEFCAAAANTIRRVLVDYARTRKRQKRGGPASRRITLDTAAILAPVRPVDLCDLDEALVELEKIDSRRSRVVELKYFCGLTDSQTAEALRVSERTVRTDWNGARLWLQRQLAQDD